MSRNQPGRATNFGDWMGAPARIVGKRTRPLSWDKPHQGKQEMARRVRQMQHKRYRNVPIAYGAWHR